MNDGGAQLNEFLLAPGDFSECRSRSFLPVAQANLPPSFKSEKRRKTQQFILSEKSQERPLFEHKDSEIDIRLLDDSDMVKLFSGVSRLIFRHVREGQQHAAPQRPVSFRRVRVRTGFTAEDFDGHHFFEFANPLEVEPCWRRICCCRRRRGGLSTHMATPDTIFHLLHSISIIGHFPKELIVLSAIYIERLLSTAHIALTPRNWRPISVAALLVSSKMWEDICPWNRDFAEIMARASPWLKLLTLHSLYRLETKFLKGMGWNASVSGEAYAAYYFALLDADMPADSESFASRHSLFDEFSLPPTSYSSDDLPAHRSPTASLASVPEELAFPGFLVPTRDMPAGRSFTIVQASIDDALPFNPKLVTGRLDPSNPYVGTFRHASESAPPSRHINSRRPSQMNLRHGLAKSQSLPSCVEQGASCGTQSDSEISQAHSPRVLNDGEDATETTDPIPAIAWKRAWSN